MREHGLEVVRVIVAEWHSHDIGTGASGALFHELERGPGKNDFSVRPQECGRGHAQDLSRAAAEHDPPGRYPVQVREPRAQALLECIGVSRGRLD